MIGSRRAWRIIFHTSATRVIFGDAITTQFTDGKSNFQVIPSVSVHVGYLFIIKIVCRALAFNAHDNMRTWPRADQLDKRIRKFPAANYFSILMQNSGEPRASRNFNYDRSKYVKFPH
jgi:hypothetical protein